MTTSAIPETPRRILMIDDSRFDRQLVRTWLQVENVEFLEADSGTTGRARAREQQPDLILLDLRLRGSDGFETIHRLKDDPLTRSIPVGFLSSDQGTTE